MYHWCHLKCCRRCSSIMTTYIKLKIQNAKLHALLTSLSNRHGNSSYVPQIPREWRRNKEGRKEGSGRGFLDAAAGDARRRRRRKSESLLLLGGQWRAREVKTKRALGANRMERNSLCVGTKSRIAPLGHQLLLIEHACPIEFISGLFLVVVGILSGLHSYLLTSLFFCGGNF